MLVKQWEKNGVNGWNNITRWWHQEKNMRTFFLQKKRAMTHSQNDNPTDDCMQQSKEKKP